MKAIRALITGVAIVAVVAVIGYWFASSRPLNHGFVYLALVAGLIICDRAFRLRDPRK